MTTAITVNTTYDSIYTNIAAELIKQEKDSNDRQFVDNLRKLLGLQLQNGNPFRTIGNWRADKHINHENVLATALESSLAPTTTVDPGNGPYSKEAFYDAITDYLLCFHQTAKRDRKEQFFTDIYVHRIDEEQHPFLTFESVRKNIINILYPAIEYGYTANDEDFQIAKHVTFFDDREQLLFDNLPEKMHAFLSEIYGNKISAGTKFDTLTPAEQQKAVDAFEKQATRAEEIEMRIEAANISAEADQREAEELDAKLDLQLQLALLASIGQAFEKSDLLEPNLDEGIPPLDTSIPLDDGLAEPDPKTLASMEANDAKIDANNKALTKIQSFVKQTSWQDKYHHPLACFFSTPKVPTGIEKMREAETLDEMKAIAAKRLSKSKHPLIAFFTRDEDTKVFYNNLINMDSEKLSEYVDGKLGKTDLPTRSAI